MKKLTKIAASIAIPAIACISTLTGCSGESGVHFKLFEVSAGSQASMYYPKENRTPTDQSIFEKDSEPYNKSTLSNEFMGHYNQER